MFSWAPYAFVRVVILYVAGILLGIYFSDSISYQFAVITLLLSVILFSIVALLRFTGRKLFNPGVFGVIAIFLAGYIQLHHSTDSRREDHILHYADPIIFYKAVVKSQPQQKENSWKVEASILFVQDDKHQWIEKKGKVLLYLSRKDFATPYQYGDVLLIKGSPKLVEGPSNPGEFDYKNFLTYRKIYHQHFLHDNDVLMIEHDPPYTLMEYSIRARAWADEALKRFVHGEQEQATASALVLGETNGLDNDLIGAYAATGSLHVLSVSGLHVGIIYWLILLLFKPMTKTKSGRWFLAIFSIIILWQYAFVTGLSPSVLRAVTMFSFVAIAGPGGFRTNIYNTLAASAFCLLIFEPYLIMSVGFQLSYLAVVGIVYLQPMLYRAWEPKSLLLDRVWQITCVSIAAQVATFSLGLLYFHQFPVYFLFSNLFVIPGSFAVLVLGIVVIFVSFISPVAIAVGFLLEWIIRILNMGVFLVEDFPYSLINHVYITTFQCWLLMAAIVAIFFLIEFRKFSFVVISVFFLGLFAVLQWAHYHDQVNQQQLVVYKVAGHSAFDIVDNGKTFFFSDSTLIRDHESMRFHIRPNRLQSGIHEILSEQDQEFVRTFKGCKVIRHKNVSVLHIHDKEFSLPPSLNVDYLIIGRNAVMDIRVFSSLKFKKLILDSSNSLYFANKIVNKAKEFKWNTHSVLHQGAFIAKL